MYVVQVTKAVTSNVVVTKYKLVTSDDKGINQFSIALLTFNITSPILIIFLLLYTFQLLCKYCLKDYEKFREKNSYKKEFEF